MSDIVQYEVRGRIALITLNRPEARNAVNGDVAQGMEAAVDQLEADATSGSECSRRTPRGRPTRCSVPERISRSSGRETPAALNTKRGGFGGYAYRERTKADRRGRRRARHSRRL